MTTRRHFWLVPECSNQLALDPYHHGVDVLLDTALDDLLAAVHLVEDAADRPVETVAMEAA